MKIVQINSVCSGSTGKIAHCISSHLDKNGIENYILYAYGDPRDHHDIPFSGIPEIKANALKSRILGNYGFNSAASTKRLIGKLEELQPDIIHLHITHAHDINIEMLCDYLKDKKTVWTMHDCWLYTGYCPHYTYARCSQWQTECRSCVLRKEYSWFFDHCRENYQRKKKALTGIKDLTVVTPSEWLKKETEKSFLHNCEILKINNGIDLNLFRILPEKEEWQKSDQKMILCVGLPFTERKGIHDVLELSRILPEEYQIVVIGAEDRKYPDNVIPVTRTENQQKLVEYYNKAFVLLNTTHEDNFPTVNLEALACGTPVITYQVGGASEAVDDETGIVVKENDIAGLKNAVQTIIPDACKCRNKAELMYSDSLMSDKYIQLYRDIMSH